jgi:Fe-S-cluster containining protein
MKNGNFAGSNPSERRLSFAEASESPCASCPTTPCCAYLPLGRIRLESLAEVDHARFLLNFDRIELGLFRSGRWEVFYRAPCRFLDPAEAACRIHDRPEQPRICRHYNPYRCWYKAALTGAAADGFFRVDRARLEAILPRLVFAGDGRLVDVPDWPALQAAWNPLPLPGRPLDGEFPGEDRVDRAWREEALRGGGAAPAAAATWAELADPCAGCAAWCCRAVTVSHGTPATATNLDFLRFLLGFPGVSVGVAAEGWHIVVRTACRHFTAGRCAVYGRSERPLECRYLDAWGCVPRARLGWPRLPGYLRLNLEHFDTLTAMTAFDADGRITALPPADALRERIEADWRAAAPRGGAGSREKRATRRRNGR